MKLYVNWVTFARTMAGTDQTVSPTREWVETPELRVDSYDVMHIYKRKRLKMKQMVELKGANKISVALALINTYTQKLVCLDEKLFAVVDAPDAAVNALKALNRLNDELNELSTTELMPLLRNPTAELIIATMRIHPLLRPS